MHLQRASSISMCIRTRWSSMWAIISMWSRR
jgi:hypothetical protein